MWRADDAAHSQMEQGGASHRVGPLYCTGALHWRPRALSRPALLCGWFWAKPDRTAHARNPPQHYHVQLPHGYALRSRDVVLSSISPSDSPRAWGDDAAKYRHPRPHHAPHHGADGQLRIHQRGPPPDDGLPRRLREVRACAQLGVGALLRRSKSHRGSCTM
jgi:hypothetical protein